MIWVLGMGSTDKAGGGGQRGRVPPSIFTFNITPMGVAWALHSTAEGPRPLQYSEGGGASGFRSGTR